MMKIISKFYLIVIAGFILIFAGNDPFNISSFSDTSKSIPPAGNDFILPSTNTTLQQIMAVTQDLGKGQVLLRRRFGANEYGLYTGIMNSKAYSKLSAFKPTENLTISAFVSRKIYSFQTENPDQDIENVYFDGDLIYVENMATIFYYDSVWRELRMLEALPCRLNVTSDPPGAPVYINNEYQDTTPLYMGAIYEPTAVIKIDLKGYFIAENFIDLQSGVLLEKHFELKKKPVFDDGSEIDIEAYTAENTESVLEINQRIETVRNSSSKIKNDSSVALTAFISNYPPMPPKDQFETTEEFLNRTNEYNAKFNNEMEGLKKQFDEKRSRVLNVIPQMEAYRDSIKDREYTKYFDGKLLKLSTYNADSGFFPVTLAVIEKGFNFNFSGKLHIPRDDAKEFYSKGTGSAKIMLIYKNWQVTVTRQDSLQDTIKESYYVYDNGLKLKFKEVDYELKGQCTYPDFITQSPEYTTFLNALDKRREKERIARETKGTLLIETIPQKVLLSILAGKSQIDTATTPVKHQLQPGPYNIVLKADGYNDTIDSLIMIKDTLIQKNYTLSHTKAFVDSVAFSKKKTTRRKRNIRRIIFSSLTFAGSGAGCYFETEVKKSLKYYNSLNSSTPTSVFDNAWNKFEGNSTKRNICYVLSGISCGFLLISIPF